MKNRASHVFPKCSRRNEKNFEWRVENLSDPHPNKNFI